MTPVLVKHCSKVRQWDCVTVISMTSWASRPKLRKTTPKSTASKSSLSTDSWLTRIASTERSSRTSSSQTRLTRSPSAGLSASWSMRRTSWLQVLRKHPWSPRLSSSSSASMPSSSSFLPLDFSTKPWKRWRNNRISILIESVQTCNLKKREASTWKTSTNLWKKILMKHHHLLQVSHQGLHSISLIRVLWKERMLFDDNDNCVSCPTFWNMLIFTLGYHWASVFSSVFPSVKCTYHYQWVFRCLSFET